MEEPARAELEAKLRLDDLYEDEQARLVLQGIKLSGFKLGYVPDRIGNFVEIGENDYFTGEWVPTKDDEGKVIVKEVTPALYFRWKNLLLTKLSMITDYRRFLDMRKKEKFLVQKAIKAKKVAAVVPAPRLLPGRIFKRNIRRYQPREFDVSRAAIQRIACEMLQNNNRFQLLALEALQSAAEAYLVGLFSDARLAAAHGRRKTLMPKDVALARRIRKDN